MNPANQDETDEARKARQKKARDVLAGHQTEVPVGSEDVSEYNTATGQGIVRSRLKGAPSAGAQGSALRAPAASASPSPSPSPSPAPSAPPAPSPSPAPKRENFPPGVMGDIAYRKAGGK